PSVFITHTPGAPSRFEPNAIRVPSGDHAGDLSRYSPDVSGIGSPPGKGILTMRVREPEPLTAATHRRSGEMLGDKNTPVPLVIGLSASVGRLISSIDKLSLPIPRSMSSERPSAEMPREKGPGNRGRPDNNTRGFVSWLPPSMARSSASSFRA